MTLYGIPLIVVDHPFGKFRFKQEMIKVTKIFLAKKNKHIEFISNFALLNWH